ncbi:MAG: hypothetical protein ACOVNU_11615 [Candidatus Kapaibacteriota bacterium]
MAQQTLEEAAETAFYYEYGEETSVTDRKREAFIEGAKSDAARDYWYAKFQQELLDTSKVNRVEVIQHSEPYNGRAYTNYFAKDVEIHLQDESRTLKIFLK